MLSAVARSAARRVLYFAPRQCWPTDTGAKLRNFHLARQLASSALVTYLGFSDSDASLSATDNSDPLYDVCERVITVPRGRGYTLEKMARGIVGKTPLPILNYTTRAMAQELARILDEKDFDLVQVEGIQLSAYLPVIRAARSRPLLICDWHNVESELMRRYSERAPGIARRLYARATARKLERVERLALREFDAHTVVSSRDRDRLLDLAPDAQVFIIENGVDVDYYSAGRSEQAAESRSAPLYAPQGLSENRYSNPGQDQPKRVLFVGSMDYSANVDGAVEFAREVWPRLHKLKPGLVFTIVGRNPAPEVRALAGLPGIEVTGTVVDVRPYYQQAIAAVVPLRIGGGSRLKILEAMAAGVPVISTRLGAEGLEVTDGENIQLADAADKLCRALVDVSEDEGLRRKLTAAARSLVQSRYDWREIGDSLAGAHLSLLEKRRDRASVSKAPLLEVAAV